MMNQENNKPTTKKATIEKYTALRDKYNKKFVRSHRYFLWVKFLKLFVSIVLLVLSLVQIRYNVFPYETIIYYISISTILALITFIESIISMLALRPKIDQLQDEITGLKTAVSKSIEANDAHEVVAIYEESLKQTKSE